MPIFDIVIDNYELEESYFLKGTYPDNSVESFDIDMRQSRFSGFGGGESHKIPKIAKISISIAFNEVIIKAIKADIKDGK